MARSVSQHAGCPSSTSAPAFSLACIAGGCFWGLELAYQRLPGVVKTSVGYTAGQVCKGRMICQHNLSSGGLTCGWFSCVRMLCFCTQTCRSLTRVQVLLLLHMQVPNPTYEEVCSGRTGHTEAVQVRCCLG